MTSARQRHLPRHREPELERDITRSPSLGYEAPEETGLVRCLAHGFPSPLVRWHFHDEYELHLITETSGKAFIGDWIGPFQPGHLVLCGPRLPHNWISLDVPEGGAAGRDRVIQFRHEPIERAAEEIPELREVLQLLERSRHGIEFFGLAERALAHWDAVKARARAAPLRALLRIPGRPRAVDRLPPALQRADAGRGRRGRAWTRSTPSSTASPPTWPSRSSWPTSPPSWA